MKRILITLTVCLFSLTACATFPPPEISNGRYINPKYGFSIEVPDGWFQTEKAPTWLKAAFTENDRSKIRIMFFNNETNGLVYIVSDKPDHSIPPAALDEMLSSDNVDDPISLDNIIPGTFADYMYQPMKQMFEKRKQQLLKDSHIKNYSYKIYNIKKHTEEYSYETEFNKTEVRFEYLLYRCQGDGACVIGIVLISDVKTFDENYAVFNKVIGSFREFEYIPENKTKVMFEGSMKDLLRVDWIAEMLGWWAAGSIGPW